jgi:N6-adenosine-specific RNA methylase IME4
MQLEKWNKAKQAIAECKTIDEAKQIRDKAEALRAYARQAKESLQVQNDIAEIKLRAERRIGEFSKELPVIGHRHYTPHDGGCKTSILREAGLTHPERYEAIASLPDAVFEAHIANVKQSNEELTSVGIIRVARQIEKEEKREKYIKVELPAEVKYRVIYADPPWKYNDIQDSDKLGGAGKHYPTMSIDDLCTLPIGDMTLPDAVLFLWTTSPLLEETFEVIKAWGFNYKTSFIWDKIRHNMGHYNSVRHELLLVCTKGSCTPDVKKLYDSVVTIEKTEKHSEKPEEFRDIIDTIYPYGKRIELFARKRTENWDVWGNEKI